MTRARSGRRPPKQVLTAVRPVVERLAAAHGLMVWSLGFVREAGRETLRVACDREGGVSADELSRLAGDLSRELDHTDAVRGDAPYVLEVTSPGAERTLRTPEQFAVCRGRTASVTLTDGRRVQGEIDSVSGEHVEIRAEDGAVPVRFEDIARARLRVTEVG